MTTITETNVDAAMYSTFGEIQTNTSRKDMIKFIIKKYPDYIQNESYKNQTLFVISQLGCMCTDCNGNDSIGECKIETYYFDSIKLPEIHNTVYI